MSRKLTAVERLIAAMEGTDTGRSRSRIAKTTVHLNARNVFPTGILEQSVGLVRDGKWWSVEIYYHVGTTLVCSQTTTRMNRASVLHSFQIIAANEIFQRPAGPTTQRLYKKHPEYKQLQEIAKNVRVEQDKVAREADSGPDGESSKAVE